MRAALVALIPLAFPLAAAQAATYTSVVSSQFSNPSVDVWVSDGFTTLFDQSIGLSSGPGHPAVTTDVILEDAGTIGGILNPRRIFTGSLFATGGGVTPQSDVIGTYSRVAASIEWDWFDVSAASNAATLTTGQWETNITGFGILHFGETHVPLGFTLSGLTDVGGNANWLSVGVSIREHQLFSITEGGLTYTGRFRVSYSATIAPEPGTALLLGLGLAALAARRR